MPPTPQQNAATVALQLEKVRDKLPLLYERDDILLTMIQQRGDVEKVSSRQMRLPLQTQSGGVAGQATMDGDDLGRGSGTAYNFATVTPIFFRFATEITKLVEYATNASEKAIENAAKKEIKNSMAQFRAFLDKLLNTSGNGVMATLGALSAGSTWNTTTPFFSQLLYWGQQVSVYDATLTVKRATEPTITAIDPDTGFVTFDANPAGMIATDVLLPAGLQGASPVSLFGLPYHQNNAATGMWMGLNRASFPQIRSPQVNAAQAGLVSAYPRLALNLIRRRLGINQLGKVIAYMELAQQHAWEQLQISMTTIMRTQASDSQKDVLLSQDPGAMAGAKVVGSINANPTRIDFLDLSHWGRAVMKDIDFYEVGGQTMFPIYGASGGLAAAYIFYYVLAMQVWNDNPRAGAYIQNLAKPAGY